MSDELAQTLERAFAALEIGDLDSVRRFADAARKAGIAGDSPDFLQLQALVAWAEGELDEAQGLFEQAIEQNPTDPRVYIEAAELAADLMDFDAAEDVLRSLLEREDVELDTETAAETYLLLAQARLAHEDDDPEEALELLDEIDASLRGDPAWVSVRAAALGALGRHEEAVAELERGIAGLGDEDPLSAGELRYQLGLAHRALGNEDAATEVLLDLRRRDLAAFGVDPEAPLSTEERDDLRRLVEEVLESLPDPILKLVATAPIHVRRWISEDQVKAGADLRTPVLFEGQPAGGSDEDDAEEPKLEGIIVFRDMLLAEIDEDEELADAIVEGLVEELDRFYDIEGLIPGI